MEYQTLDYYGTKITVGFKVDGKYYPATQYQPEEHPEIEMLSITAYDSQIDITPLLSEEQQDGIYNALLDIL